MPACITGFCRPALMTSPPPNWPSGLGGTSRVAFNTTGEEAKNPNQKTCWRFLAFLVGKRIISFKTLKFQRVQYKICLNALINSRNVFVLSSLLNNLLFQRQGTTKAVDHFGGRFTHSNKQEQLPKSDCPTSLLPQLSKCLKDCAAS